MIQRLVGTRVFAWVLLAGVLFLTCAPVCGNAIDVDPDKCCAQHSAGHESAGDSDPSADPAGCCARGQAAYPLGYLYASSATALSSLPVVAHASISSVLPVDVARAHAGFMEELLKIPLPAVYVLTSTYRI